MAEADRRDTVGGLDLPGGGRLRLGADLDGVLAAGVLVCDGVRIAGGESVLPEVEARGGELRALFGGSEPGRIAELTEARRLYRSVGVDPTRHRPSSEALLRRVLRGKGLYVINNAVDCCNLACIHFLLPIGLYDLDRVGGEVVLRLGREGEEYPGIRKGVVHLAGRLGLFDEEGPFGSPTSDSARTRVREETTRLLAVIMATGAYDRRELLAHVELLADLLRRHCGAAARLQAVLPPETESKRGAP